MVTSPEETSGQCNVDSTCAATKCVGGVELQAVDAGEARCQKLQQGHRAAVSAERAAAPKAGADFDRFSRPHSCRLGSGTAAKPV
jgi:hypothetical protein